MAAKCSLTDDGLEKLCFVVAIAQVWPKQLATGFEISEKIPSFAN